MSIAAEPFSAYISRLYFMIGFDVFPVREKPLCLMTAVVL